MESTFNHPVSPYAEAPAKAAEPPRHAAAHSTQRALWHLGWYLTSIRIGAAGGQGFLLPWCTLRDLVR